jgi:hypothetical protein
LLHGKWVPKTKIPKGKEKAEPLSLNYHQPPHNIISAESNTCPDSMNMIIAPPILDRRSIKNPHIITLLRKANTVKTFVDATRHPHLSTTIKKKCKKKKKKRRRSGKM